MRELIELFSEHDLNPFMIFNSSGKLQHYNQSAEYLLSLVPPNDLYELAINNAPKSFGLNTTHVNLHFDRYTFCAILAGYIDEDKIGLKLYKEMINQDISTESDKATTTNLFTLLKLSKNSIFANKNIEILEYLDPTIPDIKLHVESFLKLLNYIFEEYKEVTKIEIKLSLKIGKTMMIGGRAYPICNISIFSRDMEIENSSKLHQLAYKANSVVILKDKKTVIEFAMVA